MDNRLFLFLGFFAAGVAVVAITVGISTLLPIYKILFLIIGIFFSCLALSVRWYYYLMAPVVRQRRRDIVLSNEDAFWISSTGDAILTKNGGEYVSTVFVRIPLYRSGTEMTDEEKLNFSMQLTKLVSASELPVRYTSQLYIMNKDNYINIIRSNASSAQLEESSLTGAGASENAIRRARGKASMWQTMLDNVRKTTSLEMVTYATVSAKGDQEYEALSTSQQRAREVMSGIAAVFGVQPSVITGQDILKFVEPEYLIPYSTATEQMATQMNEEAT
jgi:hypothetical protein